MARDQFVLSGLNVLLETLPDLDQRFFETSMDLITHSFSLEDGSKINFLKTGFTRSGRRNISYTITLSQPTSPGQLLKIYVFNPSDIDPSVNMRGVRSAIEYFMSTGSAIQSRDVDVGTPQDA